MNETLEEMNLLIGERHKPVTVDLVQGTPEWLAWRNGGVGASDVSVLLGLSDDSTPFRLYTEKTTGVSDKQSNFAMLTGHEREPQVRAGLELELGREYAPACLQHPRWPWLLASADGWNAEAVEGYEIKFVGKVYYDLPAGNIKPKHMAQLQQQMLVSGAKHWWYAKTIDGQFYKVEKVEADLEAQAALLQAAGNFMDFLLNKVPPPYVSGDWVPNEDHEVERLVNEFKLAKIAEDEKSMKALRTQVMALVKHDRTTVGIARISRLPKSQSIRFIESAND